MSWSDDMRCLYCDGRLPLYRKFAHGQFCSGAHRKSYWREQEKLAVERLNQTHNSIRAYQPPTPVEAILGPADHSPEKISGFVSTVLVPYNTRPPLLLPPEIAAFEPEGSVSAPRLGLPSVLARYLEQGALIPWAQLFHPLALAAQMETADLHWRDVSIQPSRPAFSPIWTGFSPAYGKLVRLGWRPAAPANSTHAVLLAEALAPRDVALALCRPSFELSATLMAPSRAGRVRLSVNAATGSPFVFSAASILPIPGRIKLPAMRLAPDGTQVTSVRQPEEDAPFADRILRVAPFGIRSIAPPLPLVVIEPLLVMPRVEHALHGGLVQQRDREVLFADYTLRMVPFGIRNAAPLRQGAIEPLLVMPGVERASHGGFVRRQEREIPFADRVLRLAAFGMRNVAPSLPQVVIEPLAATPRVELGVTLDVSAATRSLRSAGLRRLELGRAALVPGTLIVERGIPPVTAPEPQLPFASAAGVAQPELRLAHGYRYSVQFQGSAMKPGEVEPTDFMVGPGDVAMPHRSPQPAAVPAPPVEEIPDPAGILPLNFRPGAPAGGFAAPRLGGINLIPQPLESKPVIPPSRLEPLASKPTADLIEDAHPAGFSNLPRAERALAAKAHPWTHAADFWRNAPRDLKLLIFAIPALLALAFHPALPKVRIAAAPSTKELKTEIGQNLSTAVNSQLANVRQAVYDRAAVALDEDFRSGLDDWTSRGDATAGWSFDGNGFAQPGPLALYKPTMNLTDYQMQFLGMIDEKALSWVVRAADFDNYYVIKMVVRKPGPLTKLGITRYAVIHGKAQDRVDTTIPMDGQPQMLYRVRLDVHDDTFALAVQGQMVDSWTEPRLPHGGVGFFTARGEKSRLRWVQVTHQYDMLGRLCAYLAPYDNPTSNGAGN